MTDFDRKWVIVKEHYEKYYKDHLKQPFKFLPNFEIENPKKVEDLYKDLMKFKESYFRSKEERPKLTLITRNQD